MGCTVTARNLACVRGGTLVFEGLSFSLNAGDALVLTGPNGSGKSSLLRVLAGFIDPVEGSLELDVDGTGDEPGIAYVGHLDAVKPSLTAMENIAFWAELYGRTAAVPDAMQALRLEPLADVQGRTLSAGQKRRTALARLLVSGAELWLLDEPESGLDRRSVEDLVGMIESHRAGGGMVVLSTHGSLPLKDPKSLALGGGT